LYVHATEIQSTDGEVGAIDPASSQIVRFDEKSKPSSRTWYRLFDDTTHSLVYGCCAEILEEVLSKLRPPRLDVLYIEPTMDTLQPNNIFPAVTERFKGSDCIL